MIAEMTASVGCEAQREPRKNVFVMAAVYAEAGSAPVKVRNVSSSGALIEGAVVPPVGSRVRLCRGSLSVSAQIIWSRQGRAGLHFESAVSVVDWLPRGRGTVDQHRVDEMVQQVKASELAPSSVGDGHNPQASKLSARELTQLTEAIESLADDLAGDPQVMKLHMLKLQILDRAAQALRKLAAER